MRVLVIAKISSDRFHQCQANLGGEACGPPFRAILALKIPAIEESTE